MNQRLQGEPPRGDGHYDAFLFVVRSDDFETVQYEEDFHRGVTDSLVSVDKGMTLYERETKRGGFLNKGWVQLDTIERGERLCECGLNSPEVAHTGGTAGR